MDSHQEMIGFMIRGLIHPVILDGLIDLWPKAVVILLSCLVPGQIGFGFRYSEFPGGRGWL